MKFKLILIIFWTLGVFQIQHILQYNAVLWKCVIMCDEHSQGYVMR